MQALPGIHHQALYLANNILLQNRRFLQQSLAPFRDFFVMLEHSGQQYHLPYTAPHPSPSSFPSPPSSPPFFVLQSSLIFPSSSSPPSLPPPPADHFPHLPIILFFFPFLLFLLLLFLLLNPALSSLL